MYFLTSGLSFRAVIISRLSGKEPLLVLYKFFMTVSVVCCQAGKELATYITPWLGLGGGDPPLCCGWENIGFTRLQMYGT